ncbi:MAG: hypothetical protein MZW92_58170 [Comamonadaceae bacterium]|nr:hypothetical protein [Comamonadaceae bacterium]
MLNTPVFGAARPRTLFDLVVAMKPDPATGKPDPEKVKAFKATHPDNATQADFLASNNPAGELCQQRLLGDLTPSSSSIGPTRPRRYAGASCRRTGRSGSPTPSFKSSPPNFLEQALIERAKQGPLRWDMILTVRRAGRRGRQPDAGLAREPQADEGRDSY